MSLSLRASNRYLGLLFLSGWLILSLGACRSTSPPEWHWERAEAGLPRQAIVLTVAADPTDSARLWAGTYSPDGLARSQDGGQTWTLGAAGLAGNPVFDLLARPDGRVLAATRDGLIESLDGGASWQPLAGDLSAATAFALTADGTGRLYVGLDDAGLYAEAQTGAGWESLSTVEELASAAVLSLAVSSAGQQIYAGTAGRGIFASVDGGRTWVKTYADEYVPNIALNPNDPAQAIASLRNRLVRTRDGGQTWHTLPVPWARNEITALLWLTDGRLGVGTGQGRLYQSLDGGDSWTEGRLGSAEIGSVLALTVAGGRSDDSANWFLAGTWTGLFASGDGGQSWDELAPFLGKPNAHALLNTKDDLLLGTQAGLFRWQADTGRWEATAGEILPSGVASLAAAPATDRIIYAGTGSDGVFRSDDGGVSWQALPSLSVGIPALAIDPTDPDHLYMLAIWERVYESRNGGQSWQARWEGLGVTVEAASLAVDPFEPLVYVGGDTGLYRSRNGGDWDQVAPLLADQSVLALLAQPIPRTSGGGSVLYIGTTRGAYRSLNQGQIVQYSAEHLGWGNGLENISVTAFLVDPNDPQRLYAGTAYGGAFESVDWGHTWQPIGPAELADDVVESLAWGPEGELFVAAESGVWRGVGR